MKAILINKFLFFFFFISNNIFFCSFLFYVSMETSHKIKESPRFCCTLSPFIPTPPWFIITTDIITNNFYLFLFYMIYVCLLLLNHKYKNNQNFWFCSIHILPSIIHICLFFFPWKTSTSLVSLILDIPALKIILQSLDVLIIMLKGLFFFFYLYIFTTY